MALAVERAERLNVPTGIVARYNHGYSKALAADPEVPAVDAETQCKKVRELRRSLVCWAGDVEVESDDAFEKLCSFDYR